MQFDPERLTTSFLVGITNCDCDRLKDKMEDEIRDFILNPDVPDPYERHKQVWLEAHPGEIIAPGEVIHHINGNRGDNRPENLMRVTNKQHGKQHRELNKLRKKEKLLSQTL